MQVKIHRGAKSIGGSCIEVFSGDTRILIDAGAALMEDGGAEIDEEKRKNPTIENGLLPDIKGLYKGDVPSFSAVFISHAHIDHYGLLNYIHQDIPVYLSKGSHSLIEIGKVFYPEKLKVYFDNYRIFEQWKEISVGPFKVTPHLVDHSAYDASAFLIEADGKKVFYTGDFRGHGRKSKLHERLVSNPIKDVDCLLMEGTGVGFRPKNGYSTEAGAEDGFKSIFSRQKNMSFVCAAGSNIDRLISVYKAALKTGKTLVLDLYTYYVLDQLKELTPSLPPHKNDNIRIFYIKHHCSSIANELGEKLLYKYRSRKIEIEEIIANKENMVLKLPISAMRRIARVVIGKTYMSDCHFIFSMWQGYLEKNDYYANFCSDFDINLDKIHVSGHAYLPHLKSLAEAISAKKLVPIHTLAGDEFSKHFENVERITDSEPFEV